MERVTLRVIKWIELKNCKSSTYELCKYLRENGFSELNDVVVPDAMPSHLLLYEDRTYLTSFYPSRLPADAECKSEEELRDFIEFFKHVKFVDKE